MNMWVIVRDIVIILLLLHILLALIWIRRCIVGTIIAFLSKQQLAAPGAGLYSNKILYSPSISRILDPREQSEATASNPKLYGSDYNATRDSIYYLCMKLPELWNKTDGDIAGTLFACLELGHAKSFESKAQVITSLQKEFGFKKKKLLSLYDLAYEYFFLGDSKGEKVRIVLQRRTKWFSNLVFQGHCNLAKNFILLVEKLPALKVWEYCFGISAPDSELWKLISNFSFCFSNTSRMRNIRLLVERMTHLAIPIQDDVIKVYRHQLQFPLRIA